MCVYVCVCARAREREKKRKWEQVLSKESDFDWRVLLSKDCLRFRQEGPRSRTLKVRTNIVTSIVKGVGLWQESPPPGGSRGTPATYVAANISNTHTHIHKHTRSHTHTHTHTHTRTHTQTHTHTHTHSSSPQRPTWACPQSWRGKSVMRWLQLVGSIKL